MIDLHISVPWRNTLVEAMKRIERSPIRTIEFSIIPAAEHNVVIIHDLIKFNSFICLLHLSAVGTIHW